MDNPPSSKKFCFGCLGDEKYLQNYVFQSGPLKEVLQISSILLCYLCKRLAQNTEMFIQSVQGNQIFMESCDLVLEDTLKAIRSQTQPLVNLNITSLPSVELKENTSIIESFVITSSKKDIQVKSEMKEEMELCLEAEFLDNDDFPESYVKEEDDFPLKAFLKEELQLNIEEMQLMDTINSNVRSKKSKLKKNKLLKTSKIKKEILDETKDGSKIKMIYLTKKQCLDERTKMLADKKYQDLTFKCDLCIKGYTFKGCYDKHMEKHSESNGNFQCDICKQFMCSEEKLAIHMKYHTHRYQCMACGIIRHCRRTIRDHYDTQHSNILDISHCLHCKKVFKHPTSLRKHIAYAHTNKQERVQCAYCLRTFANKTVLRSHILAKHTKEMPPGENPYKYTCRECGASFKAPSQLRMHSVKHSDAKDYYCVECDRSFKSESILKHHLTTTAIHVSYTEMQFPCLQCDKRFTIRRDLDRHTNRVHLNIRPFACDRCDKTYVNNWSLKHHKQIAHEGYKRPLQYPCPMCDKIFDRNHILKSHIRTHTGERPYQCTKCPAKFNQASVLRTHDRLIHLELMRNGKPKLGTFK